MRISDWSSDVCSSDLGLIVSAGTGYPASSKLTRNASITLSSSFTVVPAISNTTSFIAIILFYVRLIFFQLQQVAKCHLTKSFYVFSFHGYPVLLPFAIPVADLQTGFHHGVAFNIPGFFFTHRPSLEFQRFFAGI